MLTLEQGHIRRSLAFKSALGILVLVAPVVMGQGAGRRLFGIRSSRQGWFTDLRNFSEAFITGFESSGAVGVSDITGIFAIPVAQENAELPEEPWRDYNQSVF